MQKTRDNIQGHCTKDTRDTKDIGIQYERELWKAFPEIAESLRILSAELRIESLSISTPILSNPVYSRSKDSISKSFRRAEVTPALALSSFSLREAEYIAPHIFNYV